MAENAKDYLHSDELSEWDTVFDPGGKQEYTEEQLIRFAEMWAKLKVDEELENISVNFVIEIGEDGEEDYQNEISLHDVLERIIELKQQI